MLPGRNPVGAVLPPLRLWFWTFAALFLILSLMTADIFWKKSLEENRRISGEIERLAAFERIRGEKGGGLSVVALGSSLLGRGVYAGREMERLSVAEGYDSLQMLRLATGRATIREMKPLFHSIIKARPDIILIQQDILFYDYPDINLVTSLHSELHSFIQSVLLRKKAAAGAVPVNRVWGDTFDEVPVERPGEPHATRFERYKENLLALKGPREVNNLEIIESLLAEAHRRGVAVIVLVIPRTKAADAVRRPEDREAIEKRLWDYKLRFGITELRFPSILDDRYYRDFSHLNSEGREIFSRWLVRELYASRQIRGKP